MAWFVKFVKINSKIRFSSRIFNGIFRDFRILLPFYTYWITDLNNNLTTDYNFNKYVFVDEPVKYVQFSNIH